MGEWVGGWVGGLTLCRQLGPSSRREHANKLTVDTVINVSKILEYRAK